MSDTIGTWMLGNARLEISAQGGSYQLRLSLPDSSVVVSGISKEELMGLSSLSTTVEQADGEGPIERWDGQSGG